MTDGTAIVPTEVAVVEAKPFSVIEYLKNLGPEALREQQELAAAYDAACAALIGKNDVQIEKGRTFKKKSAWRKLARHFNISVEIVKVECALRDGTYFYATVTARAKAPWGQVYEDVGACCTDEATGRRVITTADAIATASTRASNRAISNLIAMGEVSAEEMSKGGAERGKKASPESGPSGAEPFDPVDSDTGELLEPMEGTELVDLLTLCSQAGMKKSEFPAWYEQVTGRKYEKYVYWQDKAALEAEASKRLAQKAPKKASA